MDDTIINEEVIKNHINKTKKEPQNWYQIFHGVKYSTYFKQWKYLVWLNDKLIEVEKETKEKNDKLKVENQKLHNKIREDSGFGEEEEEEITEIKTAAIENEELKEKLSQQEKLLTETTEKNNSLQGQVANLVRQLNEAKADAASARATYDWINLENQVKQMNLTWRERERETRSSLWTFGTERTKRKKSVFYTGQ